MHYRSFAYYALVDCDKSPGVAKKIDNTLIAANNLGLTTKKNVYPPNIRGVLGFIHTLLKEKTDIVVIRFSDLIFPLLFFVLIILRIRGRKVIIDIPTPRKTLLKELESSIRSPLKKHVRKTWTYFSASWVLWPANKIIQYADEGRWFLLGVGKKTFKIGNGILIDENIPIVSNVWPDEELKLIGVAQMANWHGYDRLIRALALLKMRQPKFKVHLTLVGEGSELQALKKLVESSELQSQVTFTGMLTGAALDREFDNVHIGIASLGLYRIGLEEASVLKAREYMARGLPVVGVGKDPDFDEKCPYRFVVPNDDSVEELSELIYTFRNRELPPASEIRQFAEERLSLEGKLRHLLAE